MQHIKEFFIKKDIFFHLTFSYELVNIFIAMVYITVSKDIDLLCLGYLKK